MAKQNSPVSSKVLPRGAKRITASDGARVWLIGNREFVSKRAYLEFLKVGDAKLQTKKTAVCNCETSKPLENAPEWCSTCQGRIEREVDPEVETVVAIEAGILEDVFEDE